jgi:hypothetical protein
MKTICIFITAIAMLAAGQVHAAFVDWTSIDTTNQIASGTLGSVAVTMTTTARVPNLFSSGGILGGTNDGTAMITQIVGSRPTSRSRIPSVWEVPPALPSTSHRPSQIQRFIFFNWPRPR